MIDDENIVKKESQCYVTQRTAQLTDSSTFQLFVVHRFYFNFFMQENKSSFE